MTVVLPNNNFPELSKTYLDSFLGKTVEDFCETFGAVGDINNHCAHWVSHVLGFRIGKLCNQMAWQHRKDFEIGRSLVVNDIFNECPERGHWKDKPKNLQSCLIFAVAAHGLNNKAAKLTMDNVPRKHVGIYFQGLAYNYHNTTRGTALEGVGVNGAHFFENLYGKGTVALYGTFPK